MATLELTTSLGHIIRRIAREISAANRSYLMMSKEQARLAIRLGERNGEHGLASSFSRRIVRWRLERCVADRSSHANACLPPDAASW